MKAKADKKCFLAFGTRTLGFEGLDRCKCLTHGRQQFLNVRAHENFHHKAAARLEMQAGDSQSLYGQIQRAGLVGKAGASLASKAEERLNTSSCMKVTWGGKVVSVL